jgi:hypothetical protein
MEEIAQELELIPLAEPDIPEEQDELVQELLPRPSLDDQLDMFNVAMADYDAAILDRADWERGAAEDEEQYLGNLPDKNDPWPGCANFNVPLTMLGIETLKPRLIESILGSDPIVYAIPTEAMDEERSERTELFLNWQIRTEVGLEPLIEESAHTFLTPGVVVAKILWDVVYRPINKIHHFPLETDLDAIFRSMFGDELPKDWEPTGKSTFEGYFKTPGGAKRKVSAKFKYLEDEIQVLLRKEHVSYEGPRVHLIDPMDFIMPFKGGSSVQRLPWIAQLMYYGEDELRRKVQMGRFYKDHVQELLGELSASEHDVNEPGQELANVQAEAEGTDPDPGTNVEAGQYQVIERYCLWDMDEDGFEEEIIYWISPQLPGKLLGWDYLDNSVAHGKRPYVVGRYLSQPRRAYGLSFPRVIRDVQDEINVMHNQRVDAGTLQNTPAGFFRASMTWRPDNKPIKPGGWTAVDNPLQDINVIQWNGSTVWGQNEEALLYQYFERLTGLTDLALGRQPNRVGATRTASGTAALLSEAGLRFKTCMEAFQRFWTEIFEHILALDQQYLPPGKEFRVTGRLPEMIKLSAKEDIQGKFDLRLAATSETMNKSVLREDATTKLQLVANPLFIQTGLIGMKGLRRVLRGALKAYGELDPDMVLEPLTQAIVHTPDQELSMMQNGEDVEPSPMENIPQHLQEHMTQAQDPAIVGKPEILKRLQMHISKTQQMAMMVAMAQQMGQKGGKPGEEGGMGQPVAGEQAQNAQIGKSVGMGPANSASQGGMGGY